MSATLKPVSVKLDPETKAKIEQLAQARDRSPHWMMREAISQYVEREEKREAFRQDTLNAWQEFQQTGLHATAADVESWLATWGSDVERPAPPCHK